MSTTPSRKSDADALSKELGALDLSRENDAEAAAGDDGGKRPGLADLAVGKRE